MRVLAVLSEQIESILLLLVNLCVVTIGFKVHKMMLLSSVGWSLSKHSFLTVSSMTC